MNGTSSWRTKKLNQKLEELFMTGHRDYREEAAVARQAARLKLAEFREERQKKRIRSVVKSSKTNAEVLPSSSQIDPSDFFDEDPDQNSGMETESPYTLGEQATVNASPQLETDSLTEQALDAEAAQLNDSGTQSISANGFTSQSVEMALQNTPLSIAESDLFDLPAIGPGMVWMLHQCGIASLQQLSNTKPDDLAAKLGVVGQIVSMEPWIDYARERQVKPQ